MEDIVNSNVFKEIVIAAALAKHSYNNELDHSSLTQDTQDVEWDMIPIALLKERCWLFFDGRSKRSKLYICFRGTDSLHDAIMDCDLRRHEHPYGHVHRGFWIYYEEIREELLNIVTYHMNAHAKLQLQGIGELPEVIVTGHSLGASSAAFASIDMLKFVSHPMCITFGMPPIGDSKFCAEYSRTIKQSYRIINEVDLMPRIHLPCLEHVQREVLLPSYPHHPKTPWDPITHHSMNVYVNNLHQYRPPSRRTTIPPLSKLKLAPPAQSAPATLRSTTTNRLAFC